MPSHQAPVTSAELRKMLDSYGVEVRAHGAYGVAVFGSVEIRIPKPHKKKPVDSWTLSRIAKAIGASSYGELKSVMFDRTPVNTGRPHQPEQAAQGPTKQDVRVAARELKDHLGSIALWLGQGTHSLETYSRLLHALRSSTDSLRHWPPADGGWESPDDSGFHPSAPDAVTVGVARATGATALSVRRGTALTDWEHAESEVPA